jgi:cob(I)alamin adenosyltransferase
MKIYTKTGDAGETGLFRGKRVAKHDPRVQAYGSVDELNAVLGITILEIQDPEIRALVSSFQNELFELGADLATPPQAKDDDSHRIPAAMTERLEQQIDHFEERLPQLTQFILPGGSKGGALLHYARTVCRRAERAVSEAKDKDQINPEVLRYLNRLSDLLFVLARSENQRTGSPEVPWKKSRPRDQ